MLPLKESVLILTMVVLTLAFGQSFVDIVYAQKQQQLMREALSPVHNMDSTREAHNEFKKNFPDKFKRDVLKQ